MIRAIFVLVGLFWAAAASAQVSADRVATIAQHIHNTERVDLGASSTRESRNAFWARVIGIIHFGHPTFNPTPDDSWCLKDGGGGRPQSDDVAVKCASREFWDCIGGAGAPGYTFRCHAEGVLPPEQNVYPPPRPALPWPPMPTPPPPVVTPTPAPVPPGLLEALAAQQRQLDALTARLEQVMAEVGHAREAAASAAFHAHAINAWRLTLPPPVEMPCVRGRVPKAFRGSSEVTLCPVAP